MQTGTVKFFNEARGYGFIVDDESQKEIFVHVTGLGGVVIREKDRVEYEIVDGKKGLNATKVKKNLICLYSGTVRGALSGSPRFYFPTGPVR